MSKIILLTGPTASGKTYISIKLAKILNAQIINADSRYIYKEPQIAVAKVTKEEMDGIKHHMLNLVSLNDDYSIYQYQKEGRKILDRLIKENKNIIIVGGSGLYIKSLLYDYDLKEEKILNIDYSSFTNEELLKQANLIDINNGIHVNNRQRLERYLTYYKQNGKAMIKTDNINKKKYDFITFYLNTPRDIIYNRINKRVDLMVENGLLEEADKLKNYTHFKDIIGYKELIDYYNNEISLSQCIENIKKHSRNYAKRQETWFKNQIKDSYLVDVNYNNIDETINKIINLCKNI